MNKWVLIAICLMGLGACDSETPEKTVWDDQLKTMDKAKQSEQIILDAADLQRQQIEKQTAE